MRVVKMLMRQENLIFLLGGLALDCLLLCLLVQRRELSLLSQDSQKLHDQRQIVVLATNVFDLKRRKCFSGIALLSTF